MWRRDAGVFWGGVLVFFGVLFLLANTGALNEINWDYVWPILLIAVGAWLIIARIGPPGAPASIDSAEPREELPKAKLDIALGAGRVEVRSAALGDRLYQAHLEHAGPSPEIKLDRSTGTVRISQRFDWFMGARHVRLETQLSDAIPWQISCRTGGIRGTFELSTLTLAGFDCQTGASRMELVLGTPKGVVPVRIQGGGMTIDVVRPAGAAIKVDASGGAVQVRADGSRQDGIGSRTWSSTGADTAADRYDVSVSGGALTINVSSR